jgi:GAF domain-containing protein
MRINIDSTLTRRVLETRKSFFTEDASAEAGSDSEFLRMFRMKQYLAVPIFAGESPVFGVLGLLDPADSRPIGANDVRRAEALAAQVAVALQSVQMLHASRKNQERAENLVSEYPGTGAKPCSEGRTPIERKSVGGGIVPRGEPGCAD